MQLKLMNQECWGDYHLDPDTLHIINFKKGVLVFPNADRLCRIQILFTEPGKFHLNAGRNMLSLGNSVAQYFGCDPGVPGFDMMPDFIFNPQKKLWHVNSRANFIVFDDEPDRELLN